MTILKYLYFGNSFPHYHSCMFTVYFSVVVMFKIMTIPNSTSSQVSTIMGLSKKYQ